LIKVLENQASSLQTN